VIEVGCSKIPSNSLNTYDHLLSPVAVSNLVKSIIYSIIIIYSFDLMAFRFIIILAAKAVCAEYQMYASDKYNHVAVLYFVFLGDINLFQGVN
jgi:hypothetical protein